MPLEDEIRALKEAVIKNNELLTIIVSNGKARLEKGDAAEAGDEGKGTRPRRTRAASKDNDAEDKAPARRSSKDTEDDQPAANKGKSKIKAEDLKTDLSNWIGEYDEKLFDEDGNELDGADEKLLKRRKSRLAFVKLCYKKLDVANIMEIEEQGDLVKLHDWVEQKKEGDDPFAGDAD